MAKRKRLTKAERVSIHGMYGGRCAYCGKKIEYKDMQVDHFKPLHNGGKDKKENLRPACRSCNFYKATMDIESFRRSIKMIPNRLEGTSFIYNLALKYGNIVEITKPILFYYECMEEQNG